ncbi:S41 family peptidase [Pedobacter sp. GR22-6]|uniref:S41 family peptidase n=1 Tax=Pedobacter sp. GR22-6 TaxID=3127957 RepID=UPI00307E23C6
MKYNPGKLKADVGFVKRQLEDHHPALYWYITKKSLDYKFDSLSKSIKEPLSFAQFRYKLACVLADIGDGHMSLLFDQNKLNENDVSKFNGTKVLPLKQLEYEIIGNKLFIARSHDPRIKRGMEIVAIDKKPTRDILKVLTRGMPADGYSTHFKYFVLKKSMFSDIYSAYYGYLDTVSLQLDEGGTSSTVTITSSWESGKFNDPDPRGRSTIEHAIVKNQQGAPAILRVKAFDKITDHIFSDFFAQLKRDSIRSLELDLRGNIGGDHSNMIKLFSYLIDKPTYFAEIFNRNKAGKMEDDLDYGAKTPVQPAADHFDGVLYIYTNEGTFSAASLLAGSLQAIKRGTIIGQETGGGRNGCIGGRFVQFSLPNTSLLLKFGEMQIKIPIQTDFSGRGVVPDIKTVYSFKDFIKKEDLEHKWVIGQIWPEAYKRLWPDGK